MVDLLVQTEPKYTSFVHVTKNGAKSIYVKLNKAMYGCIRVVRLFYENLAGTIVTMGFEINPYDICVAKRVINDT